MKTLRGGSEGPSHVRAMGVAARLSVCGLALVGALAGCSEGGSETIEASKSALNANPQTTDFAVYAQNSARLMDRVGVTGGDVGVGHAGTDPFHGRAVELAIGARAHVDPTRSVLANRLLLQDRARVGDIQVNSVTALRHATFARRYPFPTAMPVLPPTAPVMAGTSALTVKAGTTFVAGPGRYAAVKVGDRGILRLQRGVYEIASLQLGNRAHLEALAPVQVRVIGGLAARDRVYLGPAVGVTLKAGDVRLEVSGRDGSFHDWPKAAAFGHDARIKAVVLVPNGTLMNGDGAVVVGAYVAKDVYLGSDSNITYQSGVGSSACLDSCDDHNPCTVDTCSVGVCVHSPSPAGTRCDDADACNGVETCDGAGRCQAGTPVACTQLDSCHVVGACDPKTGLCSNPQQVDGTSCNDANPCTKTDVCTAGVCGGTSYACADGLACTVDSCNGDGTCTFAVTYGNCVVDGVCYAGAETNPGNPCQQCAPDTSPIAWSPKPAATACDDGNACTKGDVCDGASACGGTPYSCSDGLACTADSCNGNGSCSFSIIAGNCVVQGACYAAGTTNPANPCQTCAPSLNPTEWTAKAKGTTCDDGNPCTSQDVCTAGACGGTAYTCDDHLACTADSCNGDGTCKHTILAGSCLIDRTCYATGTSNPADSCQICDSANTTTWANKADGTTCNDSNACTAADAGADGGGASSADGGTTCLDRTCISGQCTGVCVPGRQDCLGLTRRICDATGNWQNQACGDDSACTCGGGAAYCDRSSQRCVACLNDDQCVAGSYCAAGACVPGCRPGATRACYAGPAGTEGVGACHAGTSTCDGQGATWGSCVGAVVPAAETCNGIDDDCNGKVDDVPHTTCGCSNPEVDSDGDGVPDCIDLCVHDPAKSSPGVCGCGKPDMNTADSDGDGVPNCLDQCPGPDIDEDGDGVAACKDQCDHNPYLVAEGLCTCGDFLDTDGDGTLDCEDGCPADPGKVFPGICGCGGGPDVDTDHDGRYDCQEVCTHDPNKFNPGVCGCGVPDIDSDKDGTLDCKDGCPEDPAKQTPGICGCGTADVDTADSDGDGVPNCLDQCPGWPDKDSDGDGVLDCRDACPLDASHWTTTGQCGCGIDDSTDVDNDGVADCLDVCPLNPDYGLSLSTKCVSTPEAAEKEAQLRALYPSIPKVSASAAPWIGRCLRSVVDCSAYGVSPPTCRRYCYDDPLHYPDTACWASCPAQTGH